MLMANRLVQIVVCFPLFVQVLFGQQITADSTAKCTQIVQHKSMQLCYSEDYEQALWVAYSLGKNQLNAPQFERTNNFTIDPLIRTGSAAPLDYSKTGFDKGHLAPAADFAFDLEAMKQSFYMSNVSPQLPKFNRGIWKTLEAKTRAWAFHFDSIAVFVGPYFGQSDSIEFIGENQVAVPSHFYKAVYCYQNNKWEKAIAFLLPQNLAISTNELMSYSLAVDELEQKIGIDLFTTLSDSLESILESNYSTSLWPNLSFSRSATVSSNSVQCFGTTQSGSRCGRKLSQTNFCYQHEQQAEQLLQAVQCVANTQKGERCKNRTKNGNKRCYQHLYSH